MFFQNSDSFHGIQGKHSIFSTIVTVMCMDNEEKFIFDSLLYKL